MRMNAGLPKVRNVRRDERRAVWILIAVVGVLLAAIGVLLFGGPLFDDSPNTDLERDYTQLLKGMQADPGNPAILMTLAETEYELGKKSDALDHAAKAIEVSDGAAGFPVRYAQLLLLEGDLGKAEEQARAEIKLDTQETFAGPHFILAQILFEQDKVDEAIKEMEAGFVIDYTAADMRIVYAEMLAAAGERDRAVTEFETALRFLPSNQRAIDGLAALGVTYEATSTADPHGATTETAAP